MASKRTINTIINSGAITFTSTLNVQAYCRLNIGIWVGSLVAFSDVVLNSASMILTLQRQLPGDPSILWRNVDTWAVALANGQGGNAEEITAQPEPEDCQYRLGLKTAAEYGSGTIYVRLGTM